MLPDHVESNAPVYVARRSSRGNPEVQSVYFTHRARSKLIVPTANNMPVPVCCQDFFCSDQPFFLAKSMIGKTTSLCYRYQAARVPLSWSHSGGKVSLSEPFPSGNKIHIAIPERNLVRAQRKLFPTLESSTNHFPDRSCSRSIGSDLGILNSAALNF
jgi:hypothetical protein